LIIPLLLTRTLTTCRSNIQEAAHIDSQDSNDYAFNVEGQGNWLVGFQAHIALLTKYTAMKCSL